MINCLNKIELIKCYVEFSHCDLKLFVKNSILNCIFVVSHDFFLSIQMFNLEKKTIFSNHWINAFFNTFFLSLLIKIKGIPAEGLKYVIGIRGRKKLLVDDNTFYRFLSTKTNQTWYCSQRKGKKCRASFRLFPNGKLLPVITEHSHDTPPVNTRVYVTTNPNDLYYDVDNHVQIDVVAFVKDATAADGAFE